MAAIDTLFSNCLAGDLKTVTKRLDSGQPLENEATRFLINWFNFKYQRDDACPVPDNASDILKVLIERATELKADEMGNSALTIAAAIGPEALNMFEDHHLCTAAEMEPLLGCPNSISPISAALNFGQHDCARRLLALGGPKILMTHNPLTGLTPAHYACHPEVCDNKGEQLKFIQEMFKINDIDWHFPALHIAPPLKSPPQLLKEYWSQPTKEQRKLIAKLDKIPNTPIILGDTGTIDVIELIENSQLHLALTLLQDPSFKAHRAHEFPAILKALAIKSTQLSDNFTSMTATSCARVTLPYNLSYFIPTLAEIPPDTVYDDTGDTFSHFLVSNSLPTPTLELLEFSAISAAKNLAGMSPYEYMLQNPCTKDTMEQEPLFQTLMAIFEDNHHKIKNTEQAYIDEQNSKLIKLISERKDSTFHYVSREGYSALRLAIRIEWLSEEALSLLAERQFAALGPDYNFMPYQKTALFAAVELGHMRHAVVLLNHGADPLIMHAPHRLTPIAKFMGVFATNKIPISHETHTQAFSNQIKPSILKHGYFLFTPPGGGVYFDTLKHACPFAKLRPHYTPTEYNDMCIALFTETEPEPPVADVATLQNAIRNYDAYQIYEILNMVEFDSDKDINCICAEFATILYIAFLRQDELYAPHKNALNVVIKALIGARNHIPLTALKTEVEKIGLDSSLEKEWKLFYNVIFTEELSKVTPKTPQFLWAIQPELYKHIDEFLTAPEIYLDKLLAQLDVRFSDIEIDFQGQKPLLYFLSHALKQQEHNTPDDSSCLSAALDKFLELGTDVDFANQNGFQALHYAAALKFVNCDQFDQLIPTMYAPVPTMQTMRSESAFAIAASNNAYDKAKLLLTKTKHDTASQLKYFCSFGSPFFMSVIGKTDSNEIIKLFKALEQLNISPRKKRLIEAPKILSRLTILLQDWAEFVHWLLHLSPKEIYENLPYDEKIQTTSLGNLYPANALKHAITNMQTNINSYSALRGLKFDFTQINAALHELSCTVSILNNRIKSSALKRSEKPLLAEAEYLMQCDYRGLELAIDLRPESTNHAMQDQALIVVISNLPQAGPVNFKSIQFKYCMTQPVAEILHALANIGMHSTAINTFMNTSKAHFGNDGNTDFSDIGSLKFDLHRTLSQKRPIDEMTREIRRFKQIGGNLDVARKGTNLTPLHYALLSGDFAVAECLIREGANLNIKAKGSGYTPIALLLKPLHIFEFVVDHNETDITIQTDAIKTVFGQWSELAKTVLELAHTGEIFIDWHQVIYSPKTNTFSPLFKLLALELFEAKKTVFLSQHLKDELSKADLLQQKAQALGQAFTAIIPSAERSPHKNINELVKEGDPKDLALALMDRRSRRQSIFDEHDPDGINAMTQAYILYSNSYIYGLKYDYPVNVIKRMDTARILATLIAHGYDINTHIQYAKGPSPSVLDVYLQSKDENFKEFIEAAYRQSTGKDLELEATPTPQPLMLSSRGERAWHLRQKLERQKAKTIEAKPAKAIAPTLTAEQAAANAKALLAEEEKTDAASKKSKKKKSKKKKPFKTPTKKAASAPKKAEKKKIAPTKKPTEKPKLVRPLYEGLPLYSKKEYRKEKKYPCYIVIRGWKESDTEVKPRHFESGKVFASHRKKIKNLSKPKPVAAPVPLEPLKPYQIETPEILKDDGRIANAKPLSALIICELDYDLTSAVESKSSEPLAPEPPKAPKHIDANLFSKAELVSLLRSAPVDPNQFSKAELMIALF